MGWDAVERAMNNESGEFESISFVNFEVGKPSTLRVIQEAPMQRWKHWVQQNKRSYICPKKGCPICEINNKAKANGGEPKYNNQLKHHILVLNKTEEPEVAILENSTTFFNQLKTLMTEVGDLRNYDIKVIRNGKGRDTTYNVIPMAMTEITEEEQELIDAVDIDLEEYFKPPTPEQLRRLLDGEDPEEVFRDENSENEEENSEDVDIDFTKQSE